MSREHFGFSGRVARFSLQSRLTLLFAVICLCLGAFAVAVMPREEEPQISVTLADVLIPFPGASAADVEQMVAIPGEQLLSQIAGLEHIASVARPGMAIISLQFRISVPRSEALVRLYNTLHSHADAFPTNAGVLAPIVKPRDVDDAPALVLALHGRTPDIGPAALERVAHAMEIELKRVPGTRDVVTTGGPGRAIMIELDPARMRANGVGVADLRAALLSANRGAPLGDLLVANRALELEAGGFLATAGDVAGLVVGVHDGKPVLMRQVATVRDGSPPPREQVWHAEIPAHRADAAPERMQADSAVREFPAVTLSVTKQTGVNVTTLTDALLTRTTELRGTVIPHEVEVAVARNFGVIARDRAQLLFEKLVLVTLSVVALMAYALGRREAGIVFCVIVLTLSATLFATWAAGFTMNKSSLLALIISIGMLVDDAVVIVENIHRHQLLTPDRPLREIIPLAVDEVGGPTILATFTVIAALMPMATLPGWQGDFFRPIPVIPSLSMLMSLVIALTVTPWLTLLWMKPAPAAHGQRSQPNLTQRLTPLFTRFFAPLLHPTRGRHYRGMLALILAAAVLSALALPFIPLMNFNLQPGDNKSDFQVVLDMPADTPLEKTAAVLHEMATVIARRGEVTDYQIYAGTAGPIGFPGLVRQYYFRAGGEYGDIQVNLLDKHDRKEKSHAIVVALRPELTRIAAAHGGTIKVFDTPGGVPQLAPIVAQVYGPTAEGRHALAKRLRAGFENTPGIVDVSDSSIVAGTKRQLHVDRSKAALAGITQQEIVATLRAGLDGESVTILHDASKYPVQTILQLPAESHGDIDALLALGARGADGRLVPLRELLSMREAPQEQPIFYKDLLPVHYVLADTDASISSPLLGMMRIRPQLEGITTGSGARPAEYFTHAPADPHRAYSYKWDGDWQINYETFRDLGAAYVVGLALIYLLIVSQFSSYLVPLIIMAPIPLTIIGVNYGHTLLGTDFTVTSMIGMMVLAGLLVRNSILLVDFINIRVREGVPFREAVVQSANVRAQPILLTSLAAMLAALFLLDEPAFNGLAVALIFGNLVSTTLTLVVIPTMYYAIYRRAFERPQQAS